MTRDHGATLAELKDTRYTRNARKDRLASWTYFSAVLGAGAILQGWNGSIAFWVLGAVCFAVAAVLGWKAS
jgi:fatty acid desaturase